MKSKQQIVKIPKIIHYCWFGPKEIPQMEKNCIESWSNKMPDYEFFFWNEKSFNINNYDFTRQAYDKKAFAFVSDFVRAQVLKKYGGIYFDTDLEVLSNFDKLLIGNKVVLGFENRSFIGTAFMATVPEHPIFIEFYNYYKNKTFINDFGDTEIIANPSILREILQNFNIKFNNTNQLVNGIQVYERKYFFPKKINNEKFITDQNTKTIHHFEGSWLTERQRKRGSNIIWIELCRPALRKFKSVLSTLFGKSITQKIENKIRNWLR